MVKGLLKSLNLTNYHILGQKGLSTAFTRSFMKHASANGSLSTVQEMYGGIVKRGTVDVIIDRDGSSQTIFSVRISLIMLALPLVHSTLKSALQIKVQSLPISVVQIIVNETLQTM